MSYVFCILVMDQNRYPDVVKRDLQNHGILTQLTLDASVYVTKVEDLDSLLY